MPRRHEKTLALRGHDGHTGPFANAIAFLCSDQARAITGILLPIDAGWLAAVSYRTYAGGVPWKD